MSQLFERTAKTPFKLDGRPVAAGQVVTLTTSQLTRLSAAGCVERDATANRDVRRQDLPALQGPAGMASDPRPSAYAEASEAVLALVLGRRLNLGPDAWRGLPIEERTRLLVEARAEIEAADAVEGPLLDELGAMSVAKLRELAKAEGIDLGEAGAKAEIAAVIRAHRAQAV